MNNVFMESFDGVATIAQLSGVGLKWEDTGWVLAPRTGMVLDASGFTGQCLKAGDTDCNLVRYLPTLGVTTEMFYGFRVQPSSVAAGVVPIYSIWGDDNTVQLRLKRSGAKLRDDAHALLSVADYLTVGTWTYIEGHLKMTDSGGIQEVRVNGTAIPELSRSGDVRDGSPTNIGYLVLGSDGGGNDNNLRFDDLYINTDGYMPGGGTGRCQVIRGSGAGAHTDGVPDSGVNYARVNEQNVDDASYVRFTNDGEKDTYAQADTTHFVGHSVRAVQRVSRAAYLSGAKHLRHIIRDGSGTEATGADKALAASLGSVLTAFNTKPDGAAWGSFADVDACECGYEQRT